MVAANILEISAVQKSYGAHSALRNVSLSVRPGEFIALVGPSGCGKTTLLKQIAGFEEPNSGSIQIDGKSMTGVPAAQRPTSMVFQRLALFPHMTVAENIGFPLKLRRAPKAEIIRRVGEMIALMELNPRYLTRYPRQLSGGEQQRVALARSIVSNPKLLLLDEPLSALDVKLKKVLQAELKRLHRSLGVTFVHVTHDLEEAMMLADRICVMHEGEIVQVGEPSDIYYRPHNRFVAGFIGETNLFPITVTLLTQGGANYKSPEIEDTSDHLPSQRVAQNVGAGHALMMVRPELVRFLGPEEQADCIIAAKITEFFAKGSIIQYRARSHLGQEIFIEVPGASVLPKGIGDQVKLGWSKNDIYLLNGECRDHGW